MKKLLATFITSLLLISLTACGTTPVETAANVESEEATDDTTEEKITEETTTEETTTEETTTESATLDMTLDEVVETVFEQSGLELTDGTPTLVVSEYEAYCENWYIDDGQHHTITYEDGVIDGILCHKDIIFSESNPFVESTLWFMVVELDIDSDLYKNLTVGDTFNATLTPVSDDYMGWEQPCTVCAINKQFAIFIVDYYDFNPDNVPTTSSKVLPPFETDDLQLLYDAFVALGS